MTGAFDLRRLCCGRETPAAAVSVPEARGSTIANLDGVQQQCSLPLAVTQWVRDIVLQRRKLLVASLAILVATAAVWFIRESVLYECTDDARIDGEIMPLSARINGHVQQVDVTEGQPRWDGCMPGFRPGFRSTFKWH